jgi:protein-tyrosine phosphatase
MAEFVMKDMLAKAGRDDVAVESAALHTDEIGSDIHRGTRRELERHGVPFSPHRAWLLTTEKIRGYDMVIGMDGANMHDLRRIADPADAPKLRRLLDFAGVDRDVADPWYTGDFETTYADVVVGCAALLKTIGEPKL